MTTKSLGFFKRNRRLVPQNNSVVKINLGCGLAVTQGWLNVDGSLNALIASWPHFIHRIIYYLSGARQYYTCEEYCRLLRENEFVHHDLSYGIPFIDDSVDFVYSSHFLEHLHREEALYLLNESYRVLKPGGTVRICVPDLAYAIRLYSEGEKEKMLNSYFFVEPNGSHYARHKYMYDFQIMKQTLVEAGFENIVRCKYQQGLTPNLDKLDNRPEETLFVEAKKISNK
ncbi:MAG: methyltransferase domain-containing protein [Nitrospinae bacterium]|nr:methyltransferase domain-containing protein [Nitrospinota bacterium]